MSTISEVKKMQVGMPVVELKAKIMEVHARHTGTGQFGGWSIQNVLVSDGKDVIGVTVSNQDEISQEAKGEEVLIASYFNQKKNNWIGATVAADDKGNKIVKLSKTGTFCIGNIETAKEHEIMPQKPIASVPAPIKTPLSEASGSEESKEQAKANRVVNDTELEKYRSMAIAYAKDLVSSSKIDVNELFRYADTMVTYIKSGNVEIVKEMSDAEFEASKANGEDGLEDASCVPF